MAVQEQPSNLQRWVLWIDKNLRDARNSTVAIKTVYDGNEASCAQDRPD